MAITRERWGRIRTVFFTAQPLDDTARQAYLREACQGDDELEREVLRLLALEDRAGSFLDTPAIASLLSDDDEPHLAAGEILAGRYRILGLIGRGGMGDVYEAHDDVIDDVVAVKVVRPRSEALETLALRWRREAVLARKVSHSGVCRVHDVSIHRRADGGELLFLTMERLHGEPLAQRLARGPMPTDEALDLLRQVAAALDAAHGQGVLHRDVKPDNIFLEPRSTGGCRAVLTDFGLARDTTDVAATKVTETGMIAGTPGYLAPEVLEGLPATPASDIYALAVVARAMLVASGAPLPTPVRQVMTRALSHDPDARFTSAGTFVEALASRLTRVRFARRRAWRLAVGMVVAVAAMALFLLGLRLYRREDAAPVDASRILLTDMVNATQERELDGGTEILRSQLAQSPQFELIEADRVSAQRTRMRRDQTSVLPPEAAREIAMREGATLVAYSTLTRLGQDYVLSVRLEQVGSHPSLVTGTWTHTSTAPAKRTLFEAMREAAVWIRRTSGEVPATLANQDRAPSDTTTSSWDALRLFTQANALTAAGRLNEATLLLEQAIRLDPEFATAHMRLGDVLISLHRDKDGYGAWQRAIALAEQRQLTSRETLRIRGQYFDDTGSLLEAEKAYRSYTVHYPNDFLAAFLLGSVLAELDRVAEAVPWLERAVALRPSNAAAPVQLALAYLDLGRPVDARAVIARLDERGHGDWATWLRALAIFASGDVAGGLSALEPLRTSTDPQWRSRAYTLRASWLAEAGRRAEALTELDAGIAFDAKQGIRDRMADKWLHAAELELLEGRPAAAVGRARHALDVAGSARRAAAAGSLYVRAGQPALAASLLATFDDYPQVHATEAARQRLLGELALERGEPRRAVTAMTRAFSQARRRESRKPLALAYLRAGETAGAEAVLAVLVEHPVRFYIGPEPDAPGSWREAATALVDLVGRRDPAAAARVRLKYPAITTLPVARTTVTSPAH